MNDQKKKYLYYSIIGACLVITVFAIFFMNSGGGTSDGGLTLAPTGTATVPSVNPKAPQTNADLSELQFTVPQVYPAQSTFPTNVLNDSRVSSFKDYDSLIVGQDDQQKDNPFANY